MWRNCCGGLRSCRHGCSNTSRERTERSRLKPGDGDQGLVSSAWLEPCGWANAESKSMRKPGKGGPANSRFKVQGLRSSETSPKKWSSQSPNLKRQNPLLAAWAPPPEGWMPMHSSEPAPSSPRPWTSARARPRRRLKHLSQEESHSRVRSHSEMTQPRPFWSCC